MNLSNIYKLTAGCKEFQSESALPIGSNTIDHTNGYKLVCNNSSSSSAAIAVFDLDFVKTGARIVFEIEARRAGGVGGSIEIDSRTAKGLNTGRKIVAARAIDSGEWSIYRVEWFVADGANYINVGIGGATGDVGQYEFRNPVIRIYEGDNRLGNVAFCNLVRTSGVWSVDQTVFQNVGGFRLESASGDAITLSFREVSESLAPIAIVGVDTGFSMATAGFINAGPHTITKNSLKIRLIKTDGSFASDVNTGGNCRINVALHFQ